MHGGDLVKHPGQSQQSGCTGVPAVERANCMTCSYGADGGPAIKPRASQRFALRGSISRSVAVHLV